MKNLILILTLLISTTSLADSVSTDFGSHSGEVKNLTQQQLRERLQIVGTIYSLSPDGNRFNFKAVEMRKWMFSKKGDLTSNWSFASDRIKKFALKTHWKFDSKGRMSVDVKQYDKMTPSQTGDRKPIFGKVLRKKTIQVKDFAPITWEIRKTRKHKVVIRFTPTIIEQDPPLEIDSLPISGKNTVMVDNKGLVWLRDATFSGKYVAITTYHGTIYLSYKPFKGAKEIGTAKNSRMELKVSKDRKISLISSAPLLPFNMNAKVYGKLNTKKTSSSPYSVQMQTGDDEKDFLKHL